MKPRKARSPTSRGSATDVWRKARHTIKFGEEGTFIERKVRPTLQPKKARPFDKEERSD